VSSGQISLKNRLNRGRDMAIFIFFKMAATAKLNFQNFNFSTVQTVKRVELHHYASLCITMPNFVEIASTVAEVSRFFDISTWRPPPSYIFNI